MVADPKKMTCKEFQAELSELLISGEDLFSHPHLQGCERCRALVVDLEMIAEMPRRLYPGEGPLIN